MGEEIDSATQQAPHPARQSIARAQRGAGSPYFARNVTQIIVFGAEWSYSCRVHIEPIQEDLMKSNWSARALIVLASLALATAALAEKPTVGVAEFRNDTSAGWWHGSTGSDLASMLTNELATTEKFRIVERAKLGPVLEEQDLGASGRVDKHTAAKIGKLTGAQYLVMGTVSSFEENTQGTGGGLSFHGFSVGGKHDEAYIAVDLRVVDTTTGEVVHTRTIEARSSSYGVNGGVYHGGFGGDLGHYSNTPVGKAIRACLVEISDYLSCVMVDKDGCEKEYQAKESSRREKTKKSIKLD
jgi:curli biogenesis system outer membrane secretion channel CsgG